MGIRAFDILSRKWLADFYMGVSARAAGDNSRFMELMRTTAAPSPRFRGHRRLAFDLSSKIRHAEFFLARHALAEAGEKPGPPSPVRDVWNLMVAHCQVFIARRRKAARKTPPVQKSAEKPQEHVGGAGEAYTHLLIAVSKTFRPTPLCRSRELTPYCSDMMTHYLSAVPLMRFMRMNFCNARRKPLQGQCLSSVFGQTSRQHGCQQTLPYSEK